jgi:hypothetical protein
VEADPSQTQPSVPSNIGATRHARLAEPGVLDASRALLFARCCVDSNGRRARWVLLRWWSGPVTRLGRAQRAAKLARGMAPCRLGSGRCMVEVLFALLITETSELGVSWRYETGRPRRQALRRRGCHRCETRPRESTQRSAAQRGKIVCRPCWRQRTVDGAPVPVHMQPCATSRGGRRGKRKQSLRRLRRGA